MDACEPCAPGTFNCDGTDLCESAVPCACDPAQPNACGAQDSYCDAGTCKLCPLPSFNCDGLGPCESPNRC